MVIYSISGSSQKGTIQRGTETPFIALISDLATE